MEITRRHLLAALGVGVGGYLVGDLASAVAQAGAAGGTQMRIGTVRSYDAQRITVDVGGGTLLGMPYLRSYLPLLGDFVTCVSTGATWMCLGVAAGSPPDNAVLNPSFEADTPGSLPANWGWYHDPSSTTNATTAKVVSANWGVQPVDGQQAFQLDGYDSSGAGLKFTTDYLYSNPFAVNPGERWVAAAWYSFRSATSSAWVPPPQALLAVAIFWFNSAGAVPPSQTSTTTQNFVLLNGLVPGWTQLPAAAPSTGNVVPGGTTHGRAVLVSTVYVNAANSLSGSIEWDSVIARKIA